MIKRLFRNIFIGILAITIGFFFVDGVILDPGLETSEKIKTLLLAGGLFGVINTIILPIANFILLPIRIITLGIFSIIIAVAMVFIVDYIFVEIEIVNFLSFFLLVLITWILNFVFAIRDKDN